SSDLIKVSVGLGGNSSFIEDAREAGFDEGDGTLGDPCKLGGQSDLVCLVDDEAVMMLKDDLFFKTLKEGSIIGITSGFIAGHLKNCGLGLPESHDVAMVAPQGMDASLRSLYLWGRETRGAGFTSSIAVHTKGDEKRYKKVQDVANAWAIGIGSQVVYGSSFLSQMRADLFSKRAMLGGLWGISEALFEYYHPKRDFSDLSAFRDAFRVAASSITGTTSDLLSQDGIKKFYLNLAPHLREHFHRGYLVGYPAFEVLSDEIFSRLISGREVEKVVEGEKRLSSFPLQKIEEKSQVWKLATREKLRDEKHALDEDDAFAAGVFVGGLM